MNNSSTFINTPIAITTIMIAGSLIAYKIHTDAKYNRETVFSIGKNNRFLVISKLASSNITIPNYA